MHPINKDNAHNPLNAITEEKKKLSDSDEGKKKVRKPEKSKTKGKRALDCYHQHQS